MEYNYIYNIIDLYINNEDNAKKVNFNVIKDKDKIILELNMINDINNKTSFNIPLVNINNYIKEILLKYKDSLMIIDEKYEDKDGKIIYSIIFNNGRTLSLYNFSMIEINNLRNILYNMNIHKEELHVKVDDEVKMNYRPRLQTTGFASFKIIALATGVFILLFFISLWIIKTFMK